MRAMKGLYDMFTMFRKLIFGFPSFERMSRGVKIFPDITKVNFLFSRRPCGLIKTAKTVRADGGCVRPGSRGTGSKSCLPASLHRCQYRPQIRMDFLMVFTRHRRDLASSSCHFRKKNKNKNNNQPNPVQSASSSPVHRIPETRGGIEMKNVHGMARQRRLIAICVWPIISARADSNRISGESTSTAGSSSHRVYPLSKFYPLSKCTLVMSQSLSEKKNTFAGSDRRRWKWSAEVMLEYRAPSTELWSSAASLSPRRAQTSRIRTGDTPVSKLPLHTLKISFVSDFRTGRAGCGHMARINECISLLERQPIVVFRRSK